ncbi:MAG: hypothetical protein HGA47_02320 [Zoogloea sp.]|nr:hypothetical protein [Zoogloea sp.]
MPLNIRPLSPGEAESLPERRPPAARKWGNNGGDAAPKRPPYGGDAGHKRPPYGGGEHSQRPAFGEERRFTPGHAHAGKPKKRPA